MGLIISKKKKKLPGEVTEPQVDTESLSEVKKNQATFNHSSPTSSSKLVDKRTNSSEPITEANPKYCVSITHESISLEEAAKAIVTTPDEMWNIVKGSSEKKEMQLSPTKNRTGWKTIRLFVSSTFKDFHQEREVLVREVFPDLRLWCEERKLRLVECDLRWGVPKDTTSEETIKICLSELDRCYEDNVAPFFLNLCGNRAGWVPTFNDLSSNVAMQYGWVHGLSVTEMETVHGAFRKLNPNALFLIRTVENQELIPADQLNDFFAPEPEMQEKLEKLKLEIKTTFPETNVKDYTVKCHVDDGNLSFSGLRGDDSDFSNNVFNFFQQRIDSLYPLDNTPKDPLQAQKESHKMFLDSRSAKVFGRDKILEQIENYIKTGEGSGGPLLVVGTAGAGKSALIAKCAAKAVEMAHTGLIESPPGVKEVDLKWKVFYHFVGATPRSTDLPSFLQRLTKEMKPDLLEVPSDLEALISITYNLLENEASPPTVIFVDAINQMDEDKQQYLNRWLPEKLSQNVRIVISTIESTESHQCIRKFSTCPTEIICGPLDKRSREEIVIHILKLYNKRLDPDQLELLMSKLGSSNPLWLTLACEELRVLGTFETVTALIQGMPDDLIALEETVFQRFEQESGGDLIKACICMLEVSRHGLLESELLELLGEKKNITCPAYQEDDDDIAITEAKHVAEESSAVNNLGTAQVQDHVNKLVQETYVKKDQTDNKEQKKDKVSRPKGRRVNFLPARDWAVIYRNLKPLLRPCGDLGEGRLDFYHRSLSKAARRRYFSGEDHIKQHTYNFWHGVLADYFESVVDLDRKAEELPYHLELLLDNNRLVKCLMDWEVFHRLYSEDFSIDLLKSWQKAGGYGIACAVYKESLSVLRTSGMPLVKYAEVLEKVYGFLIQAGQYNEVLELLDERLVIETQDLGEEGNRPMELADVYYKTALCKSEVDKAHQYLNRSQIPDNEHIVECGITCIKYLDEHASTSGHLDEYRQAQANILIAHHLSNLADLNYGDVDETRKRCLDAIGAAESCFRKLNDLGKVAECLMTKAIIDFNVSFSIRQKLLHDSLDLCLKALGPRHLLTTRIYLNMGIAYEMEAEYDTSFELFLKLRETCLAVFGPSHPKTVRAINTLKEPRYIRMEEQRDRSVPDVA